MRHRTASATSSELPDWRPWVVPGASICMHWWCHLSALTRISCLIDFTSLSLPQLDSCQGQPCFASACFCFIGLLIVPSIFFKEVTGWHWLSSSWDFTAWGEAARSPGVVPKLEECKTFLLITERVIQSHNCKILTCWHAWSCKFKATDTWLSNGDRCFKTIFPGAPRENSRIIVLTQLHFLPGL